MPDFKGLAKGGWHPEKRGGGKEGGIRSEFKGVNTIAGWMGKGKDPYQESRSHQSAPLSSLRDPASFAPPPKHVHYHGASAAQSSASSPSYPQHTGGLGAPISQDVILRQQEAEQAQARAEEEETNRPPSPPKPYRVDTTGLSTTNLPKPPVRRSGGSSPSPIPAPAARKPAGPPGLPPRLPPRQNSHPDPNSPAPPPTYGEAVQQPDQGALSRLGQAGVSVPGLSIGRSASPPKPVQSPPLPARGATQSPSVPARAPVLSPPAPSRAPTQSPSVPARGPQAPQLSELQSRFAKMSTPSSTAQENANQGTTWAQKNAALKTASNFRNDPSSVSLSDARSAAYTANNFRERHGDQVAAGLQTANGLNQKFGVANRLNSLAGGSAAGAGADVSSTASSSSGVAGKKPPPPPPKKKELGGAATEPPPIPLASKPK